MPRYTLTSGINSGQCRSEKLPQKRCLSIAEAHHPPFYVLVKEDGQFRDDAMRATVRVINSRYLVELVLKRRISPNVIFANELTALEPALGLLMDCLSHADSQQQSITPRTASSAKGK